MGNCENCKFWDTTEQYPVSKTIVGECKRVKMFWDCTEWKELENEEYGRVLSEDCKNDKAFVQDGSDYIAKLITLEDFGCVQFENK